MKRRVSESKKKIEDNDYHGKHTKKEKEKNYGFRMTGNKSSLFIFMQY
jgi:hypothetical protein